MCFAWINFQTNSCGFFVWLFFFPRWNCNNSSTWRIETFFLGAILSLEKKSQLASNLKLTSTCTMTIYGEHGIMAHIPWWLSQSKHFVTPALVSPQKCLRNKCRNSILMTQHYPDLGSASNWMKQIFNQSKNYPDLGRDSNWNFCTRFSDVILRGNQWWHCKMLAVI